jgi:hypothetical protein
LSGDGKTRIRLVARGTSGTICANVARSFPRCKNKERIAHRFEMNGLQCLP